MAKTRWARSARGEPLAEQIESVVIGTGQAGLAISYYLTQKRRRHVVLEQAEHIASAWRDGRWNSFTLVIPRKKQIPGHAASGVIWTA